MLSNYKIPNGLINETSPYLLQHAYTLWIGGRGAMRPLQKQKLKISPFFSQLGTVLAIGAMISKYTKCNFQSGFIIRRFIISPGTKTCVSS